MKNIGILAFQGGVAEHKEKLKMLHTQVHEVRYPKDLENLDAIIIPGGESSCIRLLLNEFELTKPLARKIKDGLPVWGTCAGAILLSRNIDGKINESPLAILDISIARNGYGKQLDSFVHEASIPFISKKTIDLIFIRAPKIVSTKKALSLITIHNESEIVAVKQNNILATTFHPELSSGCEFHRYFLQEFIG